jgi:uncharacterized protein YutE (UPF0331/DUF86 family)
MDNTIIISKLNSLAHCVDRIRSKRPESVELLIDDYDLQDIVSLNLERAIQICVDIAAHILSEHDVSVPKTMAESFHNLEELNFIPSDLAIRLKKAVGFRNLAVHTYSSIDWNIVYSIITKRLDDFPEFARCILAEIDAV